MRIDGAWVPGGDGVTRPLVDVLVQTAAGDWIDAQFLLDSGADRTVLSADLLNKLGLGERAADTDLSGVGGSARTVLVRTRLRFTTTAGNTVDFPAEFAAFIDQSALDGPVLGRDVLNVFAVLLDRPNDLICLLHGAGAYTIR
jgi:hypothetical protein